MKVHHTKSPNYLEYIGLLKDQSRGAEDIISFKTLKSKIFLLNITPNKIWTSFKT